MLIGPYPLVCLSYDFVGTSLDESTEDIGTIQVPSSWRALIEEPATMQLLFEVYKSSGPPVSSVALECLVRLASVRRSLFASEVWPGIVTSTSLWSVTWSLRIIITTERSHCTQFKRPRMLGRFRFIASLAER